MMKLNQLFDVAKRYCGKIGYSTKQHSPEILMAVGVVGTVTSAIIACKATTKAGDILDSAKEQLEAIHECESNEKLKDEYSEEDARKDKALVFVQTGVKFAKLYAPAVILGVLSLTSIVASNDILRKRNTALVAAYTAVDTSFKEYRSRIKDRFGEQVDRETRHGIKAESISETITNEDGKNEDVERVIETVENTDYSEYARIFDETNDNYEKNSDYNLFFLKSRQALANDILNSRGYIFLNEVYEMLGFPHTVPGQIVGWSKYDGVGDGFVDFGIYNVTKRSSSNFVNGYEPAIILDFNVDGPILNALR